MPPKSGQEHFIKFGKNISLLEDYSSTLPVNFRILIVLQAKNLTKVWTFDTIPASMPYYTT